MSVIVGALVWGLAKEERRQSVMALLLDSFNGNPSLKLFKLS
jgi:hypothetical protein